MKLISIAAFLTYLTVKVNTQNLQHEQFPFPPKFPTPSSAVFPSDSSLYLPPESHSPMPYFPIKSLNNLQFQYLPPTGTKAPQMYPTPFPMMLSSIPSFEDDEDEDEDTGRIQLSSPLPPRPFNNRTQNVPSQENRKEPRMLPKTVSYRHPIDRADNNVKFPFQMGTSPTPNQTPPASRRMIISAETTRTDQLQDQVKTASFNGLQYIPAPPGFLASTTEPAIPILRLSNEMDLDGSYSYEALGADQTHYVQHSRMENMGTDKEEQVVEGSYSYVGDNGQTFTVHYVADGNGFRASGDHLPVPPPVPEIIQRSIQYNLAEEARRPPHLKQSWEDEDKDIPERVPDKEKNHHHFALSPPPRNLFTGKQPEAFSYSYGQGPNQVQASSLIAAASNNIVKTVDFTKDQTENKQNSGPISPQITFLASQGAHLPSINTQQQQQQQQQSISRMFVKDEKPSMTQLMNYEATTKENEQENNKSLWRWQYGMNANSESPPKNSISRSFGEGDDVMINFSDMTQEQYTNMIRSQMEANEEGNREIETPRFVQVNPFERNQINNPYKQYHQQPQNQMPSSLPKQSPQVSFPHSNNWYNQNINANNVAQPRNEKQQIEHSQVSPPSTYPNLIAQTENDAEQTVKPETHSYVSDLSQIKEGHAMQLHENNKQYKENHYGRPTEPAETLKVEESRYVPDSRANLVTSKHFTPPSQTVTQSYDYDNDFFEVRKIKSFNHDKSNLITKKTTYVTPSTQTEKIVSSTSENYNNWQNNNNNNEHALTTTNGNYNNWSNNNNIANKDSVSIEPKAISTSELPAFTSNTLKFSDFISHEEEKTSNFKPIFTTERVEKETTTTTTETSIDDMFNNNIFLKNLVRSDKPLVDHQNAILEEPKRQIAKPKTNPEATMEKSPKHINHQHPFNEVLVKQKPLDISDMLNYVSMKNHFEPGKVKAKKHAGFPDNFNQRKEAYYSTSLNHDQNEKHNENNKLRSQQQEELRGIIKNYKVLQRNNNINMNVQHNNQPNKDINLVPYRIMQAPNLPPLGRAGPAAKSYLPPIYV